MPKIGEIFWVASVKGSDTAQREAGNLEESYQSFAATAGAVASKQDDLAEKTGQTREQTEKANRWSRRLKGTQGLLASALFFTTNQLGVTSAVMGGYTVATRTATVATGAFYATLAGPAGLAVGAAAATLAVGVLSTELLGLTDVTPVARAETDSMAGAFADMVFLIAGPLTGYLSAAFSAVTGDFQAAKNKFVNTSVEWVKAAARFTSRVQLGFATFGVAVKTGVRTAIESADWAWRKGLNTMITATNAWRERIHDGLVGGLENSVNGAIGVLNGFVARYNRIARTLPGMGTLGRIGQVNFRTQGRQTPAIGRIQNESAASRLARVQGRGRREIAGAASRSRRQIRAFAPDTIGGGRRTAGARPAPQIGEQTINVEIGDQTLDIRNLNRGERRELARFIAEELGGNTSGIAGVK